jgi:predicted flap endonuclease-1-like 5' DNA nuclease
MKRLYYLSEGPDQDSRLAGVNLTSGQAVDVPEELAAILLAEGNFAEELLEGLALEPEAPETEITWYEPPPGEELLALDGVGQGRAGWLVEYGIPDLAAMAALDDAAQEVLAEAMPRIALDDVRAWVEQAGELLT